MWGKKGGKGYGFLLRQANKFERASLLGNGRADILGLRPPESLFRLYLYSLRRLAQLVQPFGGEVHAVEPLQRPVGEGELHELVVLQQLLA